MANRYSSPFFPILIPSFHTTLHRNDDSTYPKQGVVGVQTVAKFRSPDAPLLSVRIYLANIRWVIPREQVRTCPIHSILTSQCAC
jgi:hypothetical protein